MTTVNQYRVWCTDAVAHYEYVWGTTPPIVCPSDGGPIDTSLTAVVQSVSNTDVQVTNLPTSAFGELSVIEITPLVQLYFTYGNISQLTTNTVTGSGTVTNATGMAVVSSGAAITSSASLRSIKPIKYRIGQGIICRFTSTFTSGVVGNTQMIGLYDSENGLGFGYNETSFGIFRRSASVTTWVPQTSWNIDKLDGTGPSGLTIEFGGGFGNVFQIQFQYLGFGGLIYRVENPFTAKFITVHIIQYSNTAVVPSFRNSSFPLCLESNNTTNNTNVTVKTASMMGGVEGIVIYTGPEFISVWSNITVSNGTETFIAAFNIKTLFGGISNKAIIYALNISFATGSTDKSQIVRLRKGGTFAGAVWTDINTSDSAVQRLTGGTWNSGTGSIVAQQNVAGLGVPTNINFTPSPTSLYGVAGDNLIITLEGLGAGSSWGSLSWLEDQ